MKKHIKTFLHYQYLLRELVARGIRMKYRHSYLGIIWTLLEPLLTTLVMVVVFGTLYHRSSNFSVYILCGKLLYGFFSSATGICVRSIRSNAGIIKKVYVPKYLYPMSSVLYNYVLFLISLLVLVAVAAVMRVRPTVFLFQAFIPLVLILLLSYGVGMILATIGVFFRDIEYLWSVISMLIMYTCAIFYDPEPIIESGRGWILVYNPVFCIIQMFRSAVFGSVMDMHYTLYSAAFTLVSVIVGTLIFRMKQDKFILHI